MLTAVGDKVIARRSPPADMTAGGIVLPNAVNLHEGVVTSVGDKCTHVKVGDKIGFSDYWGNNVIKEPDGEYVLLAEAEVLFVFDG